QAVTRPAMTSLRHGASERSERATRTERAGEAARESACRGVRGAKPLGFKTAAGVGERWCEAGYWRKGASEYHERATRTERAGEAARESACRGVRGAKPLGFKTAAGVGERWCEAGYWRKGASEYHERATRTERAGEAARESACRGVRGAKPLGFKKTRPTSLLWRGPPVSGVRPGSPR